MKNTFLKKLKEIVAPEKLKNSEIRYQRLFESAKDGILILDFETGVITDANPYIFKIIDHPLNEIIGKKLWEIGLFSNKVESKLAFKEVKSMGYVRFEDMPIQKDNGKVTEVEFISNVYLENKKKVIQCNIRNITERKQIEQKQKLTSKILEILNNLDNWELTIKNILEEIKYHTGIEMVSIHLKSREGFQFDEAMKFPENILQSEQYSCKLSESDKIIYKNTEFSYIEILLKLVITGQTDPSLSNFTEGGSFFSNNFSRLKEAGDKNQMENIIPNEFTTKDFESVALIPLYSGKDIIGLLQLKDKRPGIFDLETIQFFEKTGNSIGIAFIRIQNEEKIKRSKQNLINQNKDYQKLNREYQILNMDLTKNLTRIHNINEELLISKIKAEESDKLKSAFLANISHEIRTPLNAIMGFSSFLSKPGLSKENFENFIQVINTSSLQLLSIINDIIEISKIEAGQINIETEKVDLNNLMLKLFDTYKILANVKKTSLEYSNTRDSEYLQIITDENKINQILCYLLNNAIKFTNNGKIEFGYRLISDYEHARIEFFVKDNGVGIAKEYHSLIFERFRQVETTISNMRGGNGLGLSISKALIEKMGGTIKVDSNLGIGSTFIFTIPYIKRIEDNAKHFLMVNPNKSTNWSSKTKLIVEDETDLHT